MTDALQQVSPTGEPGGVGERCWNRIGVWGRQRDKCERLAEVVHCRNCPVFLDSARDIYDRELSADYIEFTLKSQTDVPPRSDERQQAMFVFRLYDQWFALPLSMLDKVEEKRRIHQLPHNANPNVAGLVNIQGEIQICLSLSAVIGKSGFQRNTQARVLSPPRVVILADGDERWVVAVDEVLGIHRIGTTQRLSDSSDAQELIQRCIQGEAEIEHHRVVLLNRERLVQSIRELLV